MNKFASFIALCSAALLLVACEKENGTKGGDPIAIGANTITFTIGGDQSATKAAVADPIDISEESGIDGLCLAEEVVSLDDLYAPAVETKGTPVFTENLAKVFGEFSAEAYSGSNLYLAAQTYKPVEGSTTNEWSYTYPDDVEWPEGNLRFFFKAPVAADGASSITCHPVADETYAAGSISFAYASPASASAQKDILFTSKVMSEGSTDNRVLFYHALAGVKFKIGDVSSDEGNIVITSIDAVELSGVYSKGNCVITPAYEGKTFDESNASGSVARSASVAKWSGWNTAATFSQAFTGNDAKGRDLTSTMTGKGIDYPTSFNASANQGKNVNAEDASLTFYFVPQAMTNDVKLKITYTYTSEGIVTNQATATIDFGKKLLASDSNYEWKAGELRTYTIKINNMVDVAIDDVVNDTDHKKSDLVITNTGTATAYMRVAVVANWVYIAQTGDPEGTPASITPCNEFASFMNGELEFKDAPQYNSNWILSTVDGFYYYKYPVPAGHVINAERTLFQTLDLSPLYVPITYDEDGMRTAGYKPYNNCYLDVVIPVQAVRADQVATAWGSYIDVSKLEKTTID